MNERPKVLIVGAGPTGLVMAHELARDGIRCRLIDKAPHRAMESRAIAIHSRTMESLELMGLADDFLAVGQHITGVNLYGDAGRIAHADFSMLETRYPGVLGVPQDETERLLGEHLAKLGVVVERNTELIGLTQRASGVSVRLHKGDRIEEFDTDWVMGCDGAHSAVRDQLGISFSGSTYPEHFVLADIKVGGGHRPQRGASMAGRRRRAGIFPVAGGSLAVDRHQLSGRLEGSAQSRAVPGAARRARLGTAAACRPPLDSGLPYPSQGSRAISPGPGVSAW